MTAIIQNATLAEADLIQRLLRGYRHQLADIIGNFNRSVAMAGLDGPQQRSMRCCVEAVDLVLSSHEQFAKLMGALAATDGSCAK